MICPYCKKEVYEMYYNGKEIIIEVEKKSVKGNLWSHPHTCCIDLSKYV